MLFSEPLPFVGLYLEKLNKAIEKHKPGYQLSLTQKSWLSFCLMGILITNSVCWTKFERASLGTYSVRALSWMFRYSKVPWTYLLQISVILILEEYGITQGVLVIDDSDKKRSKSAKKIHRVHKIFDKTSGGYINGQTVVLLLLVTFQVTIPVGFEFYMLDPALKAWRKNDEKLKKAGISKKNRPKEPKINPNYPTKEQIALILLKHFKSVHKKIKVKAIIADALYGTENFMNQASNLFDGVQVISQLHCNQNVCFRGHKKSVTTYFSQHPGITKTFSIRGGKEINADVSSARLHVNAHHQKRFVIAIKYQGQNEYRYLVASDMSWQTLDIIQAYTLRWLIEVFFEDWKSYEGWDQLAKQPGEEGSSRGLILSLLLDHCFLLHPEQKARIENKLPASTVGSLQRKSQVESLLVFIRGLLQDSNPGSKLELLSQTVDKLFELAESKKHLSNRELGRLEPTPGLIYRAQKAAS